MLARTTLAGALVLALATATAGALPTLLGPMPWESFECPPAPSAGTMVKEWQDGPLTVTVALLCLVGLGSPAEAPPGGGGGGCSSNAYSLLSYKWNSAYTARADTAGSGLGQSGVISAFDSGLKVWDAAAGGPSIYGGISAGGSGSAAGRSDGTNQFGFKKLGGNTIAVTTTWSSGGSAVESDQGYNTNFAWSLNGEANKMDVQNIAAHESGHTFGLGHTSTASANACLTMYPYADYGETQKRTLGPGDTDGAKAKYG